jgi:hypothetical protein
MGLQRHWADFIFLSPNGLAHFLELKRLGKKLNDGQKDFRLRCIARGNPYEIAWTIDEALLILEKWKCLNVQYTPRRSNIPDLKFEGSS